MMRWLLFGILLGSLLVSAIGVITLRHESRQLFRALQVVAADRDVISVEWSRLQLEQAWLAETGRVEREARERLDMQRPARVGILVEQP